MLVVGFQGNGGGGATGITKLTGDVHAGPGTGTVPAIVAGLQTVPISVAAPTLGEVLTYTGAEWAPLAAPGGTGGVQRIRISLALAGTTTSATVIPAGAFVSACMLDVSVAYSPGTTISVGRAGALSLLLAAGDSSPEIVSQVLANQDTDWGGAPLPLIVTIAGGPAVGAAAVIVDYCIPNN